MSVDFPISPRLSEEENEAIQQLVEREPLLNRTRVAVGLIRLGISVVQDSADGFDLLLDALRKRKFSVSSAGLGRASGAA